MSLSSSVLLLDIYAMGYNYIILFLVINHGWVTF